MSFRVSRQCVLAVVLSSAVSLPALAAAPAADLDEMVVTASRTEQALKQTLAAVTVIDRAEIERLQPNSVADLLRGLPSLSISNNGGPGKATSMFLRGTGSGHVLVLIDGVRMGSVTSGGAAIQDIPVDQIERIEIVRGPFSSLYGSSAIGGVIQIFTRRAQGAFEPHVRLGIGSNADRRASAGVSGRAGNGWYAVSATHRDTDGINVKRCVPKAGVACTVLQPDRDGFRNTSLNLRGGYRFSDAWDGQAFVYRTRGQSEYDGTVTDMARTRHRVTGARLRYQPGDKVSISLRLGRNADLSDNYLHDVYSGHFDSFRDIGSLQADVGIAGGLLSVGYDWQRARVDSNTVYALDHRINRGLFAQWQQDFGSQSLQASVRRDDNQQFGGKTTGSVLWGWHMTDHLRLTASYGTAFKAPTFNQLYFPGFGNPMLGPETSRSFDIGLRGTRDWGHWSVHAYETRVDDMIAFDAAIFAPSNIDSARIRGLEASIDGNTAAWDWRLSATLMDPRELTPGANHGNLLPRRPKQQARVDLGRTFGAFHVGASVYAAAARYDDLGNRSLMGGYALTDLRLAWNIDPAWHLRLSLNNMFDHRYETAMYYNQMGRNYLLSLSYRPAP